MVNLGLSCDTSMSQSADSGGQSGGWTVALSGRSLQLRAPERQRRGACAWGVLLGEGADATVI